MRRMSNARAWLGLWLVVLLAGCAHTSNQNQVTELRRSNPNPKIVLMPLDVELSEMTVGGVMEPKADWTKTAQSLMVDALRDEKRRMGFQLQEMDAAFKEGTPEEQELVDQLNKVHGAVGKSILVHRVVKLPNKGEAFDWTLGNDVKMVQAKTGADYALFVFVRDSYASDARKAAIVAAAILGVGLQGGMQIGFASLVDLQTGNVVWFNQVARGTGDLRNPEAARETVKLLLTGYPK